MGGKEGAKAARGGSAAGQEFAAAAVTVAATGAALGGAMPGAAVSSFSRRSEHAFDVSASQSQTACSAPS